MVILIHQRVLMVTSWWRLNTPWRQDMVLADQPMLEVLRASAQRVFVPLTVGGGIRSLAPVEEADVIGWRELGIVGDGVICWVMLDGIAVFKGWESHI